MTHASVYVELVLFVFQAKLHTEISSLFLEEVLEGLAGIVGPGRGVGGFTLDRHAWRVERATVRRVFSRNPLFDGAAALQRRRGFKVSALLAAMELEAAMRALAGVVQISRENGSASSAADERMRPGQVRGSRAKALGLGSRRLPAPLFASVGILVASLSVFAVSHRFSSFSPEHNSGFEQCDPLNHKKKKKV